MITQLYRRYFQKSSIFLYPILGFKRNNGFKPKNTFIAYEGKYTEKDFKIICVFDNGVDKAWLHYQKDYLLSHKYFTEVIELSNNEIAYVFNLRDVESDFMNFTFGKYSKLSENTKKKICDYYGVHTPEWAYVETYLHPEKHFKTYSMLLDIDEKILRDVGELCELFDLEKETLTVSTKNIHSNV